MILSFSPGTRALRRKVLDFDGTASFLLVDRAEGLMESCTKITPHLMRQIITHPPRRHHPCRPSNYSSYLDQGGRGLDTALTYGDTTQEQVATALKSSMVPRAELFVTSKVPW